MAGLLLMISKFFAQNEWLSIKFSELPIYLKLEELPSVEFYSTFYRYLDQKYTNLDELPKRMAKYQIKYSKAFSSVDSTKK